jgi:hypothetical protein
MVEAGIGNDQAILWRLSFFVSDSFDSKKRRHTMQSARAHRIGGKKNAKRAEGPLT